LIGFVRQLTVLFVVILGLLVSCSGHSFVGEELPAFNPDYINGPPDLRGQALLLEFWATWCPPCRASIPRLNSFVTRYEGKGLVVVGITAEDKEKVRTFMKQMGIGYYIGCDPGGTIGKQFFIHGIPHALLTNRAGRVVWEGHPGALTDKNIEEALR
jgi:cytochrome c biogenesis protein CcmG/thiol:disulfide interchange protein DsbE